MANNFDTRTKVSGVVSLNSSSDIATPLRPHDPISVTPSDLYRFWHKDATSHQLIVSANW